MCFYNEIHIATLTANGIFKIFKRERPQVQQLTKGG